MHFITILLPLLAGSALALPSPYLHATHERRDTIPHRWSKRDAAPSDSILPMRIALQQENLHQISAHLDAVSDPSSHTFGQHWSAEKIANTFSPAEGSIRAVRKWLKSAGVEDGRLSASRGWVEFQCSVAQAEALLRTKYHVFKRDAGTEDEIEHVACSEYSVPGHVSEHIDFITPTIGFSDRTAELKLKRKRSLAAKKRSLVTRSTDLNPYSKHLAALALAPVPPAVTGNLTRKGPNPHDCSQSMTPDCIRALYGVPRGTTNVTGNALGIFEDQDVYDQTDLDLFYSAFAAFVPNGTAPLLNSIDGGVGPITSGPASGEPLLDFEVAQPLIYPQAIALFQVDDATLESTGRPVEFDNLLDALDGSFCAFAGGDNATVDQAYPNPIAGGFNGSKACGTFAPPAVLSISWEVNEDWFFTPAYQARQCLEFAKLGLAGTSVVFSSGDAGVSASNCANPARGRTTPQFPSGCPFVTSVGGTMLRPGLKSFRDPQAEVAAWDRSASFSSGGGFSNLFETPAWQKSAVQGYLAGQAANANRSGAAVMPADAYNASSRGYPDVSAAAVNITTFTNGQVFNNGGTSASAPLFAALVTLVNEERLSAGKKSIGFLNPTLYAHPDMFRDVVSGNNSGCGLAGFQAAKGWDPVTGLGSPRWTRFREVLVGLP